MNSALLTSKKDTNFWKGISDIFTENDDETMFDYFFNLQDVYEIQSDDEKEYCQEMANWSVSKQNEFLTSCLKVNNPEITELIHKLIK